MASRIVELFPPAHFNFNDIAFVSMEDKQVFFDMAQRIDTSNYCEGKLIVRLYDRDIDHSSDKITVALYEDPYTTESPGTSFEPPPEESAIATVEIDGGSEVPGAFYANITGSLGNMAKVIIAATRAGDSNATNSIRARIDATLVLKSCS